MRTFFESTIPFELVESASLDGCNDLVIFFRIVLPLSGPILAVMVLFYGVAQWNSWFPALLYISDRGLYPLQMVLREVSHPERHQQYGGFLGVMWRSSATA